MLFRFQPQPHLFLFLAVAIANFCGRLLFGVLVNREPASVHDGGTTPPPRLPNFLLIGVQKSGTTYIANNLLRRRGDVCGPLARDAYHFAKEAHFMDQSDQMALGADAYARLFQHCPENARVLMDATPAYQLYPENVRAIYEEFPGGTAALKDLKLLIILREPVQRDIAWYNYLTSDANMRHPPRLTHTVMKKSESNQTSAIATFKTFEEYAREWLYPNLNINIHSSGNNKASEPQQPHRGLYAYWLQRWIDAGFRRDQLWVVSYDDEVINNDDPRVFLNRMYSFVNLSSTKRFEKLHNENKGAFAATCPDQEELARAYQRPNEELYQWLDTHPGPAVERRPFPKFQWRCSV